MNYTYNNTNNHPIDIAKVSIVITIAYNKDPDADAIAISNENMDAIVEYFKDHEFYPYCADLTMDGQLKFKEKPVISYIEQPVESKTTKGSWTAEDIKRALNKVYGAGMFHKEASDA